MESVWLYALASIVSLVLALDGSPVSWIATLAVMLASFYVARTLSIVIMPGWMPYIIQMAAGLVVVYVMLGSQVQASAQWLDLAWIGALTWDDMPSDYTRGVAFAGLASTLFWWRGGRLAAMEFPAEHLSFTFRIGLITLCIAAVIDIFHSANLNIFRLMFVFFAAGLAGLGVGHILQGEGRTLAQKSWIRVIGMVVGGVTAVGLLLSVLQQGALAFVARPLLFLLDGILWLILYGIILPIVYILSWLASGVWAVLSRFIDNEPRERPEEIGGFGEVLQGVREQAESNEPSAWLDALGWVAIVVIVAVLLFFLARAYLRRTRWRRVDQEGEREAISGEVDPAMDLARLLFGLLPERFRRRRADASLRLPDDDQNIVEVFRIYFGMLSAAESKGMPRRGYQTPDEYRATLDRVFPRQLVRTVTAAFNRACYGRRPASEERIAEMREMLEQSPK